MFVMYAIYPTPGLIGLGLRRNAREATIKSYVVQDALRNSIGE